MGKSRRIRPGDRYGRWTVIEKARGRFVVGRIGQAGEEIITRKLPRWRCRCDCGEEKTVDQNHLRSGKVSSCGCLRREVSAERLTTHGQSRTSIYRSWTNMIQICDNMNSRQFKYRGAVGVKVCEEWKDFAVFHAWAMNSGYREGLDLCLIDDRKDYGPDNCRFMTTEEMIQHSRAAKLDAEKVRVIRAKCATGIATQRSLARVYGVTECAISKVVNRKTWKNIP